MGEAQEFAMVVVRANCLNTLEGSSWDESMVNESGKVVLILDPTSKSDLAMLSIEGRKRLECANSPKNAFEEAGADYKLSEPRFVPLTTSTHSLSATQCALSGRQRDVLKLIVRGMSNKEIARALGLAEGTVKIHVTALFAKLGICRRGAAAIAGTRFLSGSA